MIPVGLLLVIVLVLGIVWHGESSPPAFQDQELHIPAVAEHNDASECVAEQARGPAAERLICNACAMVRF